MAVRKRLRKPIDAQGKVIDDLPAPGSASAAATRAYADSAGGGGGSGHIIQEDGAPLTAQPALNFGTGLTATNNAGASRTDVVLATHAHAEADITGLTAALAAKEAIANKGTANGYASLGVSARVPVAQLGSGTPDGTKFLRDDGVFATPAGGGGGSLNIEPIGAPGEFYTNDTDTSEQFLTGRWVDMNQLATANVELSFSGQSKIDGGSGTIRVRHGGAVGGADGSVLMTSAAIVGTSYGSAADAETQTRPTGMVYLKLTLQNNTLGKRTFVRDFHLHIKGAP